MSWAKVFELWGQFTENSAGPDTNGTNKKYKKRGKK
jgi:hypothetical protein